jgi:soluble lytic murein transglycosylase-like protein
MKSMIPAWVFYKYFFPPPPLLKPRKRKAGYFVFATILVAAGSWLVLLMLSLHGLYPFQAQTVISLEDRISDAFTPSVSYWSEEILRWSDAWGLDPLLIATVMQIESCGDPTAVSPAGAQGLFQVMPYHFTEDEDPIDPEINAKRGLAYLQQSAALSNGNIELTFAGYNGGHGQIDRDRRLWPGETQRYANWGSEIYGEVVSGEIPSKTLAAWLEAGGWYLCKNAEGVLGLN